MPCIKKNSFHHEQSAILKFDAIIFFSEINWVEYSGHYYFYGEQNVTWTDAKVLELIKEISLYYVHIHIYQI